MFIRNNFFRPGLGLFTFFIAALGLSAEPEYPKMGPDIYDTAADGTGLIDAALVRARAEHKQVLLEIGANWCLWCRRLNDTFHHNETVAAALQQDYVVVLVDVNHRNGKKRNDAVNDRYGDPMAQGLPVLVILDVGGRQLTTQETGALENGQDGHDPAKILAFLRQWAPKR